MALTITVYKITVRREIQEKRRTFSLRLKRTNNERGKEQGQGDWNSFARLVVSTLSKHFHYDTYLARQFWGVTSLAVI